MKKSTLLLALLFIAAGAFSQDLTSKKGETILPEGGEYALGFDASPFLNYVGNFFNHSDNSAPTANFVSDDFAIYGKKFIDATSAYRAKVRIGLNSYTDKVNVTDIDTPTEMVEDVYKNSYTDVVLGAGKEMRRGNTRIQGVYGAMAELSLSSDKMTYEPGNSLENLGPGVVTEDKSGMGIGFGIEAFGGVEIFVFPKTSIGFEYGWGLMLQTSPKGETTVTTLDANSNVIEETIEGTTSSSFFSIDTNNWGGNMHIMFHF